MQNPRLLLPIGNPYFTKHLKDPFSSPWHHREEKDSFRTRGWFEIKHFKAIKDPNGNPIDLFGNPVFDIEHYDTIQRRFVGFQRCPNIVTDAGLALISGLLLTDVSVNDADEIAIGDGAVTGSATSNGTTTTTVDTGKTDADDFHNGREIIFTSGSNIGEKQAITDWVQSTNTFTHAAFTNATTSGDTYSLGALPTSTTLVNELTTGGAERRTGANVTGTQQTTTITNDTARLVTTFTFTAGFSINEYMVGNDPTADTGDMVAATVSQNVGVSSGDSLQVTYNVQSQRA
jgi:hypothetical protein